MTQENLKLYSLLSRLPFPRSYLGKIMLLVFLGIHVPLIALIFYFTLSWPLGDKAIKIIVLTLIATLLGTALALYLLYSLLRPVSLTSQMLRVYINEKRIPDLPTGFKDQVGRLMADVQYTVEYLNDIINSLETTSTTDYLTKVYNRNGGERRLREDISRIERGGDYMSLVMFDIDDFKLINDKYGHTTGDACLKHVIEVISNGIRKGDWIARWGGDEFILLMLNAEEEASANIMVRIVESLQDNPFSTANGDEINLTLSVGICQYSSGDDEEGLFKKADSALLEAKRAGKGKIVCYNSSTPLAYGKMGEK